RPRSFASSRRRSQTFTGIRAARLRRFACREAILKYSWKWRIRVKGYLPRRRRLWIPVRNLGLESEAWASASGSSEAIWVSLLAARELSSSSAYPQGQAQRPPRHDV